MKENQETYRGISFHRTHKGYWIFDAPPPPGKWAHWCRYVDTSMADTAESMRAAIDRIHNDAPCYTGDLRYQPRVGR